jgi:hypothetical protein
MATLTFTTQAKSGSLMILRLIHTFVITLLDGSRSLRISE